ncbi:MAG: D-amino acid dehydrogenase [Ramlibacter sp.]|nr:D-amino acid dehydrogenase [Ramlibacter sp.]
MQICVMGAGIAGLAAAWQLQSEGHDVTIIDRAGAGAGASGANGAQLSYAYVQPLADPGIWAQLPGLLFSRNSPLTLRPRWDIDQWRWGASFLAACRARVSRESTVQLLALAADSRRAFERLLAEQAIECDFSATGKLVLYSDERSFAHARRQLALQQGLGVQQRAANAAECVEIEPALAGYQRNISGAIYTPGECAADCYKVCLELLRLLRARGARTIFDTEVGGLVMRSGRVAAVRTAAGLVEADAFVVALGSASARLARSQGLYLPVYPLKGYSLTLPANDSAPRVNVTDAARKVVFARIGQRLRIAGMAELVGDDLSIPATRTRNLAAAARDLFGDCGDLSQCEPWAGLRPATPTGLPVIGPHPKGPPNLVFNTGHGALGFTLAFGSAQRVAALLRAPRAHRLRPAAATPVPYSA